jgi:hypothetical protein
MPAVLTTKTCPPGALGEPLGRIGVFHDATSRPSRRKAVFGRLG